MNTDDESCNAVTATVHTHFLLPSSHSHSLKCIRYMNRFFCVRLRFWLPDWRIFFIIWYFTQIALSLVIWFNVVAKENRIFFWWHSISFTFFYYIYTIQIFTKAIAKSKILQTRIQVSVLLWWRSLLSIIIMCGDKKKRVSHSLVFQSSLSF